jgi:hypothetical protein
MTWDSIYANWCEVLGVDKLQLDADTLGQRAIDEPSFENSEAYRKALADLRFRELQARYNAERTANMIWRASRLS